MTEEETPGDVGEPTEEELRAAIEEQMRRVTVDDIVVQTAVSLLNVGGYRAGLAPGTEGERDLAQVQAAVEGVRALLPLVERSSAPELPAIRDTLARLQLAYAKFREDEAADPPPAEPAAAEETPAEGPGPAQSSGRLWVPGQ